MNENNSITTSTTQDPRRQATVERLKKQRQQRWSASVQAGREIGVRFVDDADLDEIEQLVALHEEYRREAWDEVAASVIPVVRNGRGFLELELREQAREGHDIDGLAVGVLEAVAEEWGEIEEEVGS